jgi:tripeptide aminopeptidase
MIERERLIETFCNLVKIDSPSGEEHNIAQYLGDRLKQLGLNVTKDGYGNVIARSEGDNPLMLSAHMDTVEPGRGIAPRVNVDKIESDGTTILGGDCKAGLTAILEALDSLNQDKVKHIPIEVVLTREEETGLIGANNLDLSLIQSKEAVVFDGEGPVSQITSSSPTYIGFDVEITGQSAHAGVEPEKGLSAIKIAAELINKLPQGRLDEETTFNLGLIEGGQVRNAVAETVNLQGEFRSMNLETLDSVNMQLLQSINEIRNSHPKAKLVEKITTDFHTYKIGDDSGTLRRIKSGLSALGLNPTMQRSGGGTDGNVYRKLGIDAVVVGMADHGMHTKQEYVSIPDLMDAAHLVETLIAY